MYNIIINIIKNYNKNIYYNIKFEGIIIYSINLHFVYLCQLCLSSEKFNIFN